MAEKKKSTKQKKRKIAKPPSIYERITDFSTGGYGKAEWIPKRNTGDKK